MRHIMVLRGAALLLCVTLLSVVPSMTFCAALTTTSGGLAIEVQGYPEGAVRLTLRDPKTWQYQPEGVVVSTGVVLPPKPDTATNSDASVYSHGDCTLTVRPSSPHMSIHFSCHDRTLVEAVTAESAGVAPEVKFTFPAAKTLYGLAEHAADLALRGGEVYELYNTDAFKYPVNSSKALYGAIPFVMAYAAQATTGVLFLNPSETKVRISAVDAAPACNWQAEMGMVDVFFFPGPSPAKVQQQHASLTGPTLLPPLFSLGYHQCRWNYMSTKDCLSVDEGFDVHGMPYDVLWLDLEHTEKKKYFTWDKYSFPDPKVLTNALASKGRKLVTLKDPHVKRDGEYFVHQEALKGDYYTKDDKGKPFEGECWPGRSSWPDFFNSRTREWYAQFFHDDRYAGGSRDIHTWVDMNEPSVFQGEKGTMAKSAVHTLDDGHTVTHAAVHNAYGHYAVQSVYKGMLEAGGPAAIQERPFILTRSFFPGTQRYAAMWTGDNMARWDHLQNSIPELLSLSVSNYPFCGADVGGFFYDTEEELFVRWMQAGAFTPFYRAHAHLDTKRREPWTFSLTAQSIIRNAMALRYALIPYLYTVFYRAHRDGGTVLRPLFFEFPAQEGLREEQGAYMFGPAMLVQPIVAKEASEVTVPLPVDTLWYNYFSGERFQGTPHRMEVDLGTIPLFVRGGYIVPMKLRLRRSTYAARLDPLTLFVALNAQGNSHGELYLDDGTTFANEKGVYEHRAFSFSQRTLTCATHPDSMQTGEFTAVNAVERVVLYGYMGRAAEVLLTTVVDGVDVAVPLDFNQVGTTVIVRQPNVQISADWTIAFNNA